MANKLISVTDNPPLNMALYPLDEGFFMGRELLEGQFEPVYKALGCAGLLDVGQVRVKQRDKEKSLYPRIDLMRPKLMRRPDIMTKLGGTTISQFVEQCQELLSSHLLEPRHLIFESVQVISDGHRRHFIAATPDPASRKALSEDLLAITQGLQNASESDVTLIPPDYNMNMAVVYLDDYVQGRQIAKQIAETIHPALQGLETKFDVLGYAA